MGSPEPGSLRHTPLAPLMIAYGCQLHIYKVACLDSDTQVIKGPRAIRVALGALKQRQRGCQTHQRQEQKHFIL